MEHTDRILQTKGYILRFVIENDAVRWPPIANEGNVLNVLILVDEMAVVPVHHVGDI